MVLYTDGLIESRERDLDAGMERLRTALTLTTLPVVDLCEVVLDELTGEHNEDDVALLVARTL
ncbi:SpoIIE family protein phosphatase [Nonomuraea maritima]